MQSDVIVLGGGSVGLAIAHHMNRSGQSVALLESERQLGGLFRDTLIAGLRFDIGSFVFSENDSLFAQYPELLRKFVPVRGGVYIRMSDGTLSKWPLTPFSLTGSPNEFAKILFSLMSAKLMCRRPKSVAEFAAYYCGTRYLQRYGLKSYIENLFHLPISRIDPELAIGRLQFLKNFALRRYALRMLKISRAPRPTRLARPPCLAHLIRTARRVAARQHPALAACGA
jgi:protoporphyrinogen oxidase